MNKCTLLVHISLLGTTMFFAMGNYLQIVGESGSTTWRLRMSLSLMEGDKNDLMRTLAKHRNDADMFCRTLSQLTQGTVEYQSAQTTPGEDSLV